MSEETNKTETEETVKTAKEQLTPEELEKRRVDGIEFYDKQVILLEAQLKYETLKAEVQEQKTRTTLALAQQMSMFGPGPDGGGGEDQPDREEDSPAEAPKKRKLAEE
jgi:hypothetical protein